MNATAQCHGLRSEKEKVRSQSAREGSRKQSRQTRRRNIKSREPTYSSWIRKLQFASISGIAPGHNSATGFPVRSHHLSGLLEGTAVKGELLHLTNILFYSIADTMSTREECFPRRVSYIRNESDFNAVARAILTCRQRGSKSQLLRTICTG